MQGAIRMRAVMVCVALMVGVGAGPFAQELRFTATGDGPRSEGDWMLLQRQINEDNAEDVTSFLLHVGDIWKGSERLPESHYLQVAALLRTSKDPVYIVPGDNEWNDLLDPQEGWAFWSRHLLRLDEHWKKDVEVARQTNHPENMAWVQDGVLMVGLNVVGGRVHDEAEWRSRHHACAQWVSEQFAAHGAAVRAAVIFAQARPKAAHDDFFGPMVETAKGFGKPVMYLHGDGHRYEVEKGWQAPNITRVQVDQVELARPLLITVTANPDEPFRFDRRLTP